MMNRRKILSIFLAAMMTAGILSSCGGNDGSSSQESSTDEQTSSADGEASTEAVEGVNLEGFPIVDEPMTVTMMGNKAAIHGEWEDLIFFQTMEEKTGISFEFDTPASEILEEKKNLALNSGTYAEVFWLQPQ